MPRQLPWLNKGAGDRARVKQPPKAKARTTAPPDIDDDFFEGNLLASSSKGRGKTIQDAEISGDELPDLPSDPSTPRTKTRTRDALRKERATSSSPPPIQDYVQAEVEFMRAGVSKFDLRDDEWMMVEDEFLETAKLITRHLHIAEYQKLKERIDAKKKEQVQAARPIVLGEKLSTERTMKKKAEVQEKRQRKALQDVFASQDSENDPENAKVVSNVVAHKASFSNPSRTTVSLLKHSSDLPPAYDTDSDGLDASRPTFKRPDAPAPKPNSTSALSSNVSTKQKSALPAMRPPKASTSPFPQPPSTTARRCTTVRKSRVTPFDMLDDYKPRVNTPGPANGLELPSLIPSRPSLIAASGHTSTDPVSSLPPTKIAAASTGKGSVGLDDDLGQGSSGISKATAERIAKRKAEREKERGGRKKGANLDDIPTFLV